MVLLKSCVRAAFVDDEVPSTRSDDDEDDEDDDEMCVKNEHDSTSAVTLGSSPS
jgi:hypothetical protein